VALVASKLRKLGISPPEVMEWYGQRGWWYNRDWRGKKGQKPTPEQVFETVEMAKGEYTAPPTKVLVDFGGVLEEREV
jgi:hypothetical protein